MMREIKFRVWKYHHILEHHIMCDITNESILYLTDNETFHDRILLQYTGLKDTNGVEIYEGDICTKMISPDEINLAPKELYKGEITYHFGGFCLKVDKYYYPLSRQHGVVSVIGNIYQNPELLTTKP